MVLTVQQKQQLVLLVLKRRLTVVAAARQKGVARKTIYAWLKRYQSSPSRLKPRALANRYQRGRNHPRAVPIAVESQLKRLIYRHPEWGSRRYSQWLSQKGLKIGYAGVYGLLKRWQATTPGLRDELRQQYSGPGRLRAEIKREAVEKVLTEGRSISQSAKDYGVARKTIYQWVANYQSGVNAGKDKQLLLKEGYASGANHPRAVRQMIEAKLFKLVAKKPRWRIRQLAERLSVSAWTVWQILDQNHLNTSEQRLIFAKNQSGRSQIG